MTYERELITDTNLPVIKKKTLTDYIFSGSEGKVYALDSNLACKIFKFYNPNVNLNNKFIKIELLAKYNDPSFTFPIGLVTLDGIFKTGYYMRRIITHPVVKSFAYLRHVPNLDILFDILIKACDALDRAHDRGIIVGDIKWGNILIDTSLNPIFIDTDNYAFANFGFDVRPNVTYRLEEIFEEEFSYYDNDQFLLAYMVMRELFSYHGITFMDTMTSFEKAMDYINIDNSSKDELKAIFSNEHDKPSIGPILKRVKNRDKFINVPSNASFNLLF